MIKLYNKFINISVNNKVKDVKFYYVVIANIIAISMNFLGD